MKVQKLSISEYASNIQQYTDNVSEEVVKGIVRHLGIALTNRDASLVSCSDKTELDRIRQGFLKKKLQLTASDEDLDRVISDICTTMKDTRNKSRVTFYYLLAEKFDKLSLFK
ncbi:MAG: DUF2853 family protein [Cyanobacteria bacterium P01_G01_bin.39]